MFKFAGKQMERANGGESLKKFNFFRCGKYKATPSSMTKLMNPHSFLYASRDLIE